MTDFERHCKTTVKVIADEIEQASNENRMLEYINDNMLDWEFTIDCDREFKRARFYVTLGGPTVYIDCYCGDQADVVLNWGEQIEKYYVSEKAGRMIVDIMKDFFYCR